MKQPTSDYQEVDRRFDKAFEEKYRHARNTDATEHCGICNIRHSHHYHSLDQDKQREWIKSYFHSELDRVREETLEERNDLERNRGYWEGRKEEEQRWINQPHNEHDNRVREETIKECLRIAKQFTGFHCDKENCDHNLKSFIASLTPLPTPTSKK